ncbi:uncharacterized protein LOC131946561 [Physella acuta]|uniref:uncharacterized protein LOC131946561 n=1 Tax=Physella acuta TaxID=109671 RepID=UPI0027DD8746|nr:uncharacterized protein LOC131946561 [Physella acuta]
MSLELKLSGLTFAEAYKIRKEQETLASTWKQKKNTNVVYFENYEELDHALRNIVSNLEGKEEITVPDIRTFASKVVGSFIQAVTSWMSCKKLDLLHHLIIWNKPNLITFVLAHTSFFPKTYRPATNPYAHLASLMGCHKCLAVILHHRPEDNYKVIDKNQQFQLPDSVLKKLSLSTIKPLTDINTEKLFRKFSVSKVSQCDLDILATYELDDNEEPLTDNKKKFLPGALPSVRDKPGMVTKTKIPSPSTSAASSQSGDSGSRKSFPPGNVKNLMHQRLKLSDTTGGYFQQRTDSNLWISKCPIRSIKGASKYTETQHVINVNWDRWSCASEGVLHGAGLPASINVLPTINHANSTSVISRNSHANNIDTMLHETSVVKTNKSNNKSTTSGNTLPTVQMTNVEFGVRKFAKFKDFQIEKAKSSTQEILNLLNKTPLHVAAEFKRKECVILLLDWLFRKMNGGKSDSSRYLTLASRSRCPEGIATLMAETKVDIADYNEAVITSIREQYPECLIALLKTAKKERTALFGGMNLFHILFSQSLVEGYKYEMLPDMTRALIICKENVNYCRIPRTFPLYTLIHCMFHTPIDNRIYYYIQCLIMLLQAKANPQYDEQTKALPGATKNNLTVARKCFSSALKCVFDSAIESVCFVEKPQWCRFLLKKLISTIELYDATSRYVLPDALFQYLEIVAYRLGLDVSVIRTLLRYGANPDCVRDGKYPVNVYFDQVFPYLTKFEVILSYDRYEQDTDDLLYLCKHMKPRCLTESFRIFLDDHFLKVPLQALPIYRYFSCLVNALLSSPRPLQQIVSHAIWLMVNRNKHRVEKLPVPSSLKLLILP